MPPTDPAAADAGSPERNERTSPRVARLAARAIRDPESLTPDEVQTLAASALTQAPPSGGGRAGNEPEADDTSENE